MIDAFIKCRYKPDDGILQIIYLLNLLNDIIGAVKGRTNDKGLIKEEICTQ